MDIYGLDVQIVQKYIKYHKCYAYIKYIYVGFTFFNSF